MIFPEVIILEINKEILKGYIDTIILSLLNEKAMYGYELAKRVREKSNEEFELKEGTMYLALKRLEQKKLIQSYWGEESEGGRRKYYRILPDGEDLFKQKKLEWTFVQKVINSFLGGGNNATN